MEKDLLVTIPKGRGRGAPHRTTQGSIRVRQETEEAGKCGGKSPYCGLSLDWTRKAEQQDTLGNRIL